MTTTKPPVWFWIISILALIWNSMGVNQYLQQAYNTEAFKSMVSTEELEMIGQLPTWYTAVFAIAVFAGALGCILLLLRKKRNQDELRSDGDVNFVANLLMKAIDTKGKVSDLETVAVQRWFGGYKGTMRFAA